MSQNDAKSLRDGAGIGVMIAALMPLMMAIAPVSPYAISAILSQLAAITYFPTPKDSTEPAWRNALLVMWTGLSIWLASMGAGKGAGELETVVRTAMYGVAPVYAQDPAPTPSFAYRCFIHDTEVPCGTPGVTRTEVIRLKPKPELPESRKVFREW